jgi:hypothetical protein
MDSIGIRRVVQDTYVLAAVVRIRAALRWLPEDFWSWARGLAETCRLLVLHGATATVRPAAFPAEQPGVS